MTLVDEPKVDCHNHIFDPARGPLLRLVETVIPDAAQRRKIMWETPMRLFAF